MACPDGNSGGPARNAASPERWFVAATKPSRETFALEQLTNQAFVSFLPLARQTARSGGRLIDRRVPYFPGYLFIRFDPALGSWRAVNSTRGIRRLIMAGGGPVPLPEGFVEGLGALAGSDGTIRPEHDLRVGDRVQIVAGPFARLFGTLHRMEARGRIGVLVNILNGEIPLVIDRADLAPAA
jgi:transcription antitermination factor NusG